MTADFGNPDREVLQRLLATLAHSGSTVRWDLATPYLLRHAVEHAVRAGGEALIGLLADGEYLVNADPASIIAAMPPFRDVFPERVRDVLDVYCASVGWHQSVDVRARRQILALDAIRLGHRELAVRMGRMPGGRALPWQCSWSTSANVSASSGATMTGHAGRVLAMAVADLGDGAVAITGSADRTARIWDLASGRTRRVLLHPEPVTAVAAGTTNGEPVLLTASSGLTRWRPDGAGAIDSVGDVPGVGRIDLDEQSGLALAVAASSALVVDVTEGLRSRSLEVGPDERIAFSAIGREADEALGFLVLRHGAVMMFSLDDGFLYPRIELRRSRVTSFRVADVGGQVIAAAGFESGSCFVFHPYSGQILYRFEANRRRGAVERFAVTAIGFFPTEDGWRVATGHQDGRLRTWDLGRGRLLSNTRAHADTINTVDSANIAGRTVLLTASDDDTTRCWDASTGEFRSVFAGHTSGVTASALASVDRRPVLITASRDRTIRTWDAGAEQTTAEVPGHPRWIRSLQLFALDGRPHILTACFDDIVRVVDAIDGRIVRVFQGFGDRPVQTARAGIGADGRTLIVAGGLRGYLTAWDVNEPGLPTVAEIGRGDVTALAFTPDGRVTAGTSTGDLVRWSPPAVEPPEVLSPDRGPRKRSISALTVSGSTETSLLVAGYHSREVTVTAQFSPRPVASYRYPEPVRTVAVDSTTTLVAAGSGRDVHLRRLRGHKSPSLVLSGHTAVVRSVCFARLDDAEVLFSGSTDGTVRIWDPVSGEQLHRIDLPDIVQNVDFRDGLLAIGFGREISIFTHQGS